VIAPMTKNAMAASTISRPHPPQPRMIGILLRGFCGGGGPPA